MAYKPLKVLAKLALKLAYSCRRQQVSATAVLACSTAPGLAPAPNTRNGQQIILKVSEGYRESAHKDYPGCAALASSNCVYPYVR